MLSFISEFSTLIIFGSILIGFGAIIIGVFKSKGRKKGRIASETRQARRNQEMGHTIRQKAKAAEAKRKETTDTLRSEQEEKLSAFQVQELNDEDAETTIRLFFTPDEVIDDGNH